MFQKSTNIHRVTLMFSSTFVTKLIDEFIHWGRTLQHRTSSSTPMLHYCSPIYYVYFCSSVRSKRCRPSNGFVIKSFTSLYVRDLWTALRVNHPPLPRSFLGWSNMLIVTNTLVLWGFWVTFGQFLPIPNLVTLKHSSRMAPTSSTLLIA